MARVAGGDRAALAVLRDRLRLRFGTQIGLAPPGARPVGARLRLRFGTQIGLAPPGARPVGDTDIAPGRAEAG